MSKTDVPEPQAGGSYVRDAITGELVREEAMPINEAPDQPADGAQKE